MLNAQPLGFYAPAQLVRDAREHGVEVREVDVNLSDWDCTLEPSSGALARRETGVLPNALSRHLLPEGEGRPLSPSGRGVGSKSESSSGPSDHLLPEGKGIHSRHAEMAPHIHTT